MGWWKESLFQLSGKAINPAAYVATMSWTALVWCAGTLSPFITASMQLWPAVQPCEGRFHRAGARFMSRVDITSAVALSLLKFGISDLFIRDLKL